MQDLLTLKVIDVTLNGWTCQKHSWSQLYILNKLLVTGSHQLLSHPLAPSSSSTFSPSAPTPGCMRCWGPGASSSSWWAAPSPWWAEGSGDRSPSNGLWCQCQEVSGDDEDVGICSFYQCELHNQDKSRNIHSPAHQFQHWKIFQRHS